MNMKAKDAKKGNELIAKFIGMKFARASHGTDSHGEYFAPSRWINEKGVGYTTSLNYHKDWNWLMPVVEKIENTNVSYRDFYGHAVIIDNWNCTIKDCLGGEIRCTINPSSSKISSKIEATWVAVVEFIKWYNNDKRKS
jgi:hypothetical protein